MISANNSTDSLRERFTDPRWYVVHTSANQERNVGNQFELRGVEYFLPVYHSARRWSDRRVVLELPLFPGYLFVHIALSERLNVLQVPRVAQLVGFQGEPVPLHDDEISVLRRGLSRSQSVEPHPYLVAGRRVRVVDGPFEGAEGIVLRRKNSLRVVVSLELIMRSVSIEVDEASIEPIGSRASRTSVAAGAILRSANLSAPTV